MMHRVLRMVTMARDTRGGVALTFGILLLPMLMVVGLAVDYSFYAQAQSQLNLGADAAALHAVRAASNAFNSSGNATAALQAGKTAGQQWFVSQVGLLATASTPNMSINVTYTQSPPGFSAAVSYSGTVASHLGAIFGFLTYPIAGNASAVILDAYVEVLMLLDNSSSMAIAATTADIVTMEKATMCSSYTNNDNQGMSAYSWNSSSGNCNSGSIVYTGDPLTCFDPSTARDRGGNLILNTQGKCANGGGSNGVAQAPCAFACHTPPTPAGSSATNDYYALARTLSVTDPVSGSLRPLTLRLDVVNQAAANVIKTLQTAEQSPNQFSVGIYSFGTTSTAVYPAISPITGCPASTSAEAGSNLAMALGCVNAMSIPSVPNGGDTDFKTSANLLATKVTMAGDGSSQAAPRKNLFIVTDGMQDTPARTMGPMTVATNEQTCQQFKAKGFNVYVLYTPYLPLPNPFYLTNDKQYVEPATSGGTSPILAALQACASTPANFFQASDPAAINTAMQQMLQSALNAPARVAQ